MRTISDVMGQVISLEDAFIAAHTLTAIVRAEATVSASLA